MPERGSPAISLASTPTRRSRTAHSEKTRPEVATEAPAASGPPTATSALPTVFSGMIRRAKPTLCSGAFEFQVEGDGCSGAEKIQNTKCQNRRGNRKMAVKLQGGLEGDSFVVKLSSGKKKKAPSTARARAKPDSASFPSAAEPPPPPGAAVRSSRKATHVRNAVTAAARSRGAIRLSEPNADRVSVCGT